MRAWAKISENYKEENPGVCLLDSPSQSAVTVPSVTLTGI